MKRNTFLYILVIGTLFFPHISLCQGTEIGISPVTFELTANPGDTLTNQIKVYNPSEDTSVGIEMEVEDIAPSGEGGQVTAEAQDSDTFSLMKWVEVEPKVFTLDPKSQEFVTFTINVPENAEPGGHYGAVLAKTRAASGPKFTGATISHRVGSVVLLSVAGEVEENLAVSDFSVPQYSEYGPIPFSIKFENQGTIHVKPRGLITITDWLGRKVADISVPEKNVLPGAVRKIEASWNTDWLLAGRYTATLHGGYGSANTFTPEVITFWGFSWKIGLMIAAVVTFFALTRKRWSAAVRVLLRGEEK
ncbi:MAG: DUF916 domain-containing protein [Candidatus Nealsonbacteria bacterium]|nr:DUF916 domain-containing protein [Candidatus Nealsonbacteria bacterium]